MVQFQKIFILLGSTIAAGKQCFKGDFSNLSMWKTSSPIITANSKVNIQADQGAELIVAGLKGLIGKEGGLIADLEHAFPEQDEVTLDYEVQFPVGIDFNKGGKLFGLFAGKGSCSGGNLEASCASIRIMWRENGEGVGYAYIHDKAICSRNGVGCNPPYGADLHGGFFFKAGIWHKLQIHAKMNNGQASDGFIKLNFDGKEVVNLDKVHLRTDNTVKFHDIMIHNFWGGGSSDWAPSKDTPIKFRNVNVYCGEGIEVAPAQPRNCRSDPEA